MTDIYFADLSLIPGELLLKVNEACERNIVRVPMEQAIESLSVCYVIMIAFACR